MKRKRDIPIDKFLKLKPTRGNFDWKEEEDGKIDIIVPKFKSRLGERFCRIFRKSTTFTANLDYIGSEVWKLCDGKKTVDGILKEIKEKFPKEEDLDQRLFYYLYTMKNLGYIDY